MGENTIDFLTPEELDTIGEIMNISMGAAATAISTMLEKQVSITTPKIAQDRFYNINSENVEPAVVVKIKYVTGLEGSNVVMLHRRDMQIIVNLLMGNGMPTEDSDFEFDDMSMSAACEVMNQMMGASATVLSEMFSMMVNISPPEASLVERKEDVDESIFGIKSDEAVIAISFQMTIKDVLDTTFYSLIPLQLAKKMVKQVSDDITEDDIVEEIAPLAETSQLAMAGAMQQQPMAMQSYEQAPPMQQNFEQERPQFAPANAGQDGGAVQGQNQPYQQPYMDPQQQAYMQQQQQMQYAQPQQQQMQYAQQQPQQQQMQYAQQPQQQQMQYAQQQGQQMPYMQQQQPYMQQMPYPQMAQSAIANDAPVSVKNAQFPNFAQQQMYSNTPEIGSNMGLLMSVQLEVSVIIGRTKQRIKNIIEFGQGSVLELDKQTGAPAEIVVNGQLLAYGDVIVVGDNFGVRITEIVGTKKLLDSLGKGN